MMTAIIRITAPSPMTRIKLGCLIFFEGATAEGLDGRFGGATDGAVSEIGAVCNTKKWLLQIQYKPLNEHYASLITQLGINDNQFIRKLLHQ